MNDENLMKSIGDDLRKKHGKFYSLVDVRCRYYEELDRIKQIFKDNDSYEGMLEIQKLTEQLKHIGMKE